jgi:hypothetical protein
MKRAARVLPTSRRRVPPVVRFLLQPIARRLKTGDPAATVDRLFSSHHVGDLQLIIAVGFGAVLVVFFGGLLLAFESEVVNQWPAIKNHHSDWIFVHVGFIAMGKFLTVFAPVLAAFAAVLAWSYQVGSARLGVVDLFACEISTLCRVATVVRSVRRYVDRYNRGPPAEPAEAGAPPMPARQFTSQESYFPVFESNTRDLQTLEARVVINITAFYTYMKAVRDSLRALSVITAHEASSAAAWRETTRDVIYMLYLGLESARHAIDDLVEFEPEKAERTVVILISELEAYGFLRSQFTNEEDTHHQRLKLRETDYRHEIPNLRASIKKGRADAQAAEARDAEAGTQSREVLKVADWDPAWRLLPELKKLYHAAVEKIEEAPCPQSTI